MWSFDVLLFVPLTLIYLVMMGMSVLYLYMGVLQIAPGRRAESVTVVKRSRGLVSVFLSLIMLAVATYAYVECLAFV